MPTPLGPFLGDPEPSETAAWLTGLDGRTQTHIAYARHYAATFAHGAPGHLDLMTIAAMARLLDRAYAPAQGDHDLPGEGA